MVMKYTEENPQTAFPRVSMSAADSLEGDGWRPLLPGASPGTSPLTPWSTSRPAFRRGSSGVSSARSAALSLSVVVKAVSPPRVRSPAGHRWRASCQHANGALVVPRHCHVLPGIGT
ncbi:hypothetical protein ScoT_38850 [Streptomyces albidoflavus]|uniref:Uncharacterized protein n=1 Tax=Streptomyces albidoflavus TaxID=1886 RepID=A0AA37BZI8_9ACTN|nr:hypothetical protein ScoT_38850 [Streptomyces albidoflavus]